MQHLRLLLDSEATTSLRVAQVIGRFDRGGAQRLACNLGDAIANLGETSIIIGLAVDTEAAGAAKAGEAPRYVVNARGSLLRQISAARALRRLIREQDIEMLHVHGVHCLRFVDVAQRFMRDPPRVVFTWHDSTSMVLPRSKRSRHRALRRALRRCDRLFGSSREVARRLAEATGRHSEALINGVAVTEPAHRKNRNVSVIVWTGRLVPEKDLPALLEALAQLRNQGMAFHLKVLGGAPMPDSDYEATLRQRIDQLGLSDAVEMLGWIDDVGSVLRDADIAVQTSRSEGLSMALLEQMMAGLAIVATDVGDTAVAIKHKTSGILVQPGDRAALTEALTQLLINPQVRHRLGDAARRRAEHEFSLEAMGRRAMDAYQQVMNGPSSR